MSLVGYLCRHSWRVTLLAALCGAISGLSGAALVVTINTGLASPGDLGTLGLTFAGLCALSLASKLGADVLLLRLTQEAIYQLRLGLSRRLLATPLKELQALGKHRLLVILTEDINTFTNAFEWVPILLINGVVVIGCLCYLAWLSWQMLLLLAFFLLVGMVSFHFAERRPLAHLARVRHAKDALYHQIRGLIEGSKELSLNRRRGQAFVDEVIAPSARELKGWFVRGMAGYTLVASVGMMVFYANIGLLLFVLAGWQEQPREVLTSFVVTLLYLIRPTADLMIALPTLRQASIALSRISQLAGELTPAAAAPQGADPFTAKGPLSIELRGVTHRYPGDSDDRQFTLGPLDLSIRQGEIVFLVGGNGSGKTTLAMLLLGLYEPESGAVFLNDRQVTDENREQYRQRFSAVFADFYLFEQLIGLDRPALDERAAHYLRALKMSHKVRIEGGRLSSVELSTGQRKRLALLSAYLEDRPVYLFDEWAADQDPAFKRVFYAELLPELKARGKTVIAITHDDAYFDRADRVLKLEDGKLCPASAQPARASLA